MLNAMYNSANTNGVINASNINVNRAVLDISDLCNAVKKIIVTRDDHRGIFNLASFNGSVGYIAQRAANILNCSINFDYKPSSNLVHDFAVSTDKFISIFDFKFTGSINTILESLSRDSVYKTNRNSNIEYRI
jgi:nucleoside-diphosphate-sugar epimerase